MYVVCSLTMRACIHRGLAFGLVFSLACGVDAPHTPATEPSATRQGEGRAQAPAAPPGAATSGSASGAARPAYCSAPARRLNLASPLQARIASVPARLGSALESARSGGTAWPRSLSRALGALQEHPTEQGALREVWRHQARFAADPQLPADLTLRAIVRLDLQDASGRNAPVVDLVAAARAALPGEASLPWVEALVLPERGRRRQLLEEAYALGAREVELVQALARARLRDGAAALALSLLRTDATSLPRTGALSLEATQRATQSVGLRAGLVGPPGAPPAFRFGAAPEHGNSPSATAGIAGIEGEFPTGWPSADAERLLRLVLTSLEEAALVLAGPGAIRRAGLRVRVHPTPDSLRASTCGAGWALSFYDGVLHVVAQPGALGEALSRSVRHESLHAQLDALSPLAPRWFHEGLAQRFADEPFARDRVAGEAETWLPLAELSAALGLSQDGETAGRAYRQARFAVELAVERGGPEVLVHAVEALRGGLPAERFAEGLRLTDAQLRAAARP